MPADPAFAAARPSCIDPMQPAPLRLSAPCPSLPRQHILWAATGIIQEIKVTIEGEGGKALTDEVANLALVS